MNRFSRENIESKLKFIDSTNPFEHVKKIIGGVLDNAPHIGFLGSILLFLIIKDYFFFFSSVLFGVLSIFFIYINQFVFHKFKVNKFKIPIYGLKKSFEFVYVSDIHTGKERTATKQKKLNSLIEFINSTNIETVVFGGDYIYYDIDKSLMDKFAKIKATNKIAVYGNHESLYLKEKQDQEEPREFYESFADSGFELLINESRNIDGIIFGGIPDLFTKNFDLEKTFENTPKDFRILISHNPDIFDFVENQDNVSLILSGHNHAGQVNLPIVGPLIPMPGKHRWMQRGLYEVEGKPKLFMSQGFGSGSLKTRIGTDFEVCIIKLVPENN